MFHAHTPPADPPPPLEQNVKEVEKRRGNRSSRYGEACCHRYFCSACALPSSFLLFFNEYLRLTHLCQWQIRNICFFLLSLLLHPLPLRYFRDDPRLCVAAHLSSLTCRRNPPSPPQSKVGVKKKRKRKKADFSKSKLLQPPSCLASLTCVDAAATPARRISSPPRIASRIQNAEGLSGEEGERFARKAELERAPRPRARGRLHPRWVRAAGMSHFLTGGGAFTHGE